MDLTVGQRGAYDEILKWSGLGNEQVYRLAGYAGTGKSFLTRYVLESLKYRTDEVALCTFTGKASLVLMRYNENFSNVGTIHRLIYNTEEDESGDLKFRLKSELAGVRFILLDEGGMVSEELWNDLRSFGLPILVVGDHGQLGAIGKSADLMKDPDYVLTEIMRQAMGDPITVLSMMIREGRRIELGRMGENVMVLSKSDRLVTDELLARADQVLCGFNRTRVGLNESIRRVYGYLDRGPVLGDKIIFTENDWGKEIDGFNVVNGMIGYVVSEPERYYDVSKGIYVYRMDIKPDFLSGVLYGVVVPEADFLGEELKLYGHRARGLNRMTFGYAITTHKAQGSEFDNVLVYNEPFGEEPWRHPYTAVTRAKKGLIYLV